MLSGFYIDLSWISIAHGYCSLGVDQLNYPLGATLYLRQLLPLKKAWEKMGSDGVGLSSRSTGSRPEVQPRLFCSFAFHHVLLKWALGPWTISRSLHLMASEGLPPIRLITARLQWERWSIEEPGRFTAHSHRNQGCGPLGEPERHGTKPGSRPDHLLTIIDQGPQLWGCHIANTWRIINHPQMGHVQ